MIRDDLIVTAAGLILFLACAAVERAATRPEARLQPEILEARARARNDPGPTSDPTEARP